ncbi:PREDICTED: T-cell activation Rho GTPase-activating protein-like, partial [Buceros rhinoceros silvestris]|uniref:T-cell activation Rho GTPase-activating protein-like n=1 Tax=Buceros rhinoceros silvestris TaxID=175836 RepID=UPI00052803FF
MVVAIAPLTRAAPESELQLPRHRVKLAPVLPLSSALKSVRVMVCQGARLSSSGKQKDRLHGIELFFHPYLHTRQDLLTKLCARLSSEGIFERAASEKARQETKTALSKGGDTNLYQKGVLALEKPSKQRKQGLKEAKFFILKQFLSLLCHIYQNSSTSRMNSSNLAICIGPNMLILVK